MSTRPNRLVCCWLTARLPSSTVRCKINSPQWHRDGAVCETQQSNYSTSESLASNSVGAGSRHTTSKMEAFPHTLYGGRNVRVGTDSDERREDSKDSAGPGSVELQSGFCLQNTSTNHHNSMGPSSAIQEPSDGAAKSLNLHPKRTTWSAPRTYKHRHKFQVLYINPKTGKPGGSRGETAMVRIPRRVTAAIHRAQNALLFQGRVISAESFRRDIEIRLTSLYPYVSVPKFWSMTFTALYTAKFYNQEWHPPPEMEIDQLGRQLLQILQTDGQTSLRDAWNKLDLQKRRFQWPRLAIWCLANSPNLTLEFMLATNSNPYPPFRLAVDCITYIYMYYRDEVDTNRFRSVIFECLDPERWPTIGVPQRGVRLYLSFVNMEEVRRVFTLMRQRDMQISVPLALCFMNYFTKDSDVNRAIDAFRLIFSLKNPQPSLDSEGVMRHCCKLLTLDTVHEENGVRNFKILPKLLELGLRPGRDMMNVVISNALKTGDPQLGFDMVKYMKDRDLGLDSYTYLALLKDAVARGDRAGVDALLREILPNEEFKNNPYIASKILHAHFVFTAKDPDSLADPVEIYLSMLDLYSRLYDLAPIKDLQLIGPGYTNFGQGAHMKPPSVVIYIMLASYLRCQRDSDRTHRVYRRFRQLVTDGHPVIAPLAQHEHYYNEFLHAFRDDPRTLRYCVEIVEDMLHPSWNAVTIGERCIVPAKPTVWTWTILLSAFIYNRQPHAAKKVQEMMNKHGVEYNQATWNTIISGHANAQDAGATAKSIKEMESQGYEINSRTLKPLRFLKDPERLRTAIDDLDRKTAEYIQWEQEAEAQEREELLEQALRRLAAAKGRSDSRDTRHHRH